MVEERALTVREPAGVALHTLAELERFGDIMAKSGMFNDIKTAAQAVVKIAYGKELGVPPITALTKIHFFTGKPTMSAEIMGSLIKNSGVWDYEPTEMNDERVTIQFLKNGRPFGQSSTFTMEDAKRAGVAGKDNWAKYPRNMLYARALSNGARWYCPHVIGGAYVPEELDAPIDEDGEMVVPREHHRPALGGRVEPAETVEAPMTPDDPNEQADLMVAIREQWEAEHPGIDLQTRIAGSHKGRLLEELTVAELRAVKEKMDKAKNGK